jgi:MerR family transcriptional regulator, light-induced transcriptional regulator
VFVTISIQKGKKMKKYGIQVVSNLSGVGIHTIRKWEQRYNVLSPEREDNGRRLYSESEIEKLQLLHDLTSAGHSISKLANLDNNELKTLLERISKKKIILPEKMDISTKVDPQDFLKNLFFALENYKLDIISHELSKLKVVVSGRTLVLDILQPLLKEVGLRIYNGQISVGQEYALFSILKFHLGQIIFRSYEQKIKNPQVIVFATLENDPQEIDILLASILSSHYGIKFFYLGAGLPLESILEAQKSLEANIIILGVNELLKKNNDKTRTLSIDRLLKKSADTVKVFTLGGSEIVWEAFSKEKRFSFFPSLIELDKTLSFV